MSNARTDDDAVIHELLDGVTVRRRHLPLVTTGVSGPLRLHVAEAGPPDGTPVILLHGFPDSWRTWSRVLPALARAGFRVIAPDQRGYATSDKPRGRSAYRLRHLVDDVVALQDALCGGAATHVVGHDWGGAVAWAVAMARPDRVRTLTVVNCPPPRVLRHLGLTNPAQLVRSWYILFFQLPWLPERVLAGGAVRTALARAGGPEAFDDAELDDAQAVATRDAMRAAVSWYRAAALDPGPDEAIGAPTLLVWGQGDTALVDACGPATVARHPGTRLVTVPGGGHWPHRSRSAEVTALILDQLRRG